MRKYITACEWIRIFEAITGGSNTVRDRAMFHLAYRHGLRVSELTSVRIGDLDMSGKSLYVRRLKNGLSTVQPVQSDTLCLLREWLKIREEYLSGKDNCDWLFLSQKGRRLSRQRVFRLARRYGERAGLPFAFHPHMLRHACGYALADQGLDTRLIQDYLGHRNIHHTVLYTASNSNRFSRVWNDHHPHKGL
ncbi:TPA: tyrosine-type recombinase/integrase [Salmonella enterica]|nr:integrase [Salmonella enterica]EDJ9072682.1 integrase [Salmonella enterica subsp. enterica serovar Typhimurium]EDN6661540.1 tyrosine-type recombinase/integrase [Salmonella enterica]EKQ1727759.1 tyrosine-type recombinase/integrase [Salmonella enterica]HAK8631639.1 tyrosine-type recombinase/integrase [Salmonella enterica]